MAKTYSIAIDGPAGAGKSTMAKRLAKELGYQYVGTGAIYRTVAYFLDLWGISPKDIDGGSRYIDELTINIEYDEEGLQHMIMNGMDVTGEIRTQDISQKASLVSAQFGQQPFINRLVILQSLPHFLTHTAGTGLQGDQSCHGTANSAVRAAFKIAAGEAHNCLPQAQACLLNQIQQQNALSGHFFGCFHHTA